MRIAIYILSIVVSGILFCMPLAAQHLHEFSAYATGGLSTLKYNTSAGKQKNNMGSLFGFGYTYFISSGIGFNTGIEFSFYNAEINFDDLSDRYVTQDADGENFEFRTTVSDYHEKQNATYLNIPLMVQYQRGNKNQFYVAAGGKVGLALNGTYKIRNTTMVNSGYYEEEDYEYTTQEFLGFGTFPSNKRSGELNFKMSLILSAEAGVKWKLKEGLFLYTGAYIDYGLNNIYKSDGTKPLVEYNRLRPQNPTLNSVLVSQYTNDGQREIFTDKVTPMAIGLKFKIAFGVRKPTSVIINRR